MSARVGELALDREEDMEDAGAVSDVWSGKIAIDDGVTRLGAVGFASSHAAALSISTASRTGITKTRIGNSSHESHR
jgi:hypothetical protein